MTRRRTYKLGWEPHDEEAWRGGELQSYDDASAEQRKDWVDPETGEPIMDQKQYEDDLRQRQAEHLRRVGQGRRPWQPCLHDGCQECLGTGVKRDGSTCVHCLSCPCPKCSPASF